MGVRRIWTEDQISEIIKLYTVEGMSLAEIAQKYHAKANTISKILKEQNVPIRHRGTSKNPLLKHDYFHDIDTPEKAYFLGLLFTDGNVMPDNQRSPAIRIELVETDIEILNRLKQELNCNCKLTYNKRKNRALGTYSLNVRSQQLADDLSKWNIVPNKTYVISEIKIPEKFKIDFLRGFIDGDGSIWYDSNSGAVHTGVCGHSEHIMKQIADLGNSLIGQKTTNKITYTNGVYRYSWNGSKAMLLNQLIYYPGCICIARKRDKAMFRYEDNRAEDIV